MAKDYDEIPIERLHPGTVLRFPVLQSNGAILIAEGTKLTERMINQLVERGIKSIRMHADDVKELASEPEPSFSAPVAPQYFDYRVLESEPSKSSHQATNSLFHNTTSRDFDKKISPTSELCRKPGPTPITLAPILLENLDQWHALAKERDERDAKMLGEIKQFQLHAVDRGKVDANVAMRLVDEILSGILSLPGIALYQPRAFPSHPYPSVQSLWASRLSMTFAITLGWSREEVIAIGLGGLCHDIGMLRLGGKPYKSAGRLDWFARQDLYKHPVYSLEIAQSLADIHESIGYIVYQVHEHSDGTGYPRGKTQSQIHPSARLVGIVDAYVGMVSKRLQRQPMLPHEAILELLRETQQGWRDPNLSRAFVNLLSLYPPGSFLECSDGRLGRSTCASRDDYRRPVIEIWDDPAAIIHETGVLCDLRTDPAKLTVLRPIGSPQKV